MVMKMLLIKVFLKVIHSLELSKLNKFIAIECPEKNDVSVFKCMLAHISVFRSGRNAARDGSSVFRFFHESVGFARRHPW